MVRMVPESTPFMIGRDLVGVCILLSRVDNCENRVARCCAVNVQSVRVEVGRIEILEIVVQARGVKSLSAQPIRQLDVQGISRLNTYRGASQLVVEGTSVLLQVVRACVEVALQRERDRELGLRGRERCRLLKSGSDDIRDNRGCALQGRREQEEVTAKHSENSYV